MLKLNKNKISLFLIVIAMLLLIVSFGNCEAKYKFNMVGPEPIWGDTGIILQAFESGVEYLSGGDIDISMFPAGEWGISDEECLQSLQLGNLDLVGTVSSIIGQYTDALYMFDIPFLFESSVGEMLFVFESPIKHTPIVEKVLEKASEEAKFMVLSVAPVGRRDIFSSKPIESIDDLKGLKIRTMSSPIQVDAFNFMGAKATPLPYQEVFTALQLKNIDAAENSPNAFVMMKFNEAAPYYFATDHYSSGCAVMMSMKAWNSLPTAYQNIVRQCAIGAMNVTSVWGLGSSEYFLSGQAKEGAKKMTMITPEEKLKLRKMVLPKLLDKYGEQIGIEVLETLAQGDEVIADWLKENK